MNLLDLFEADQIQQTPRAVGTRHVALLDKSKSTNEPVLLDFGTAKYRISAPQDKKWFLQMFQGYRKTGQEARFLDLMGTRDGFERLLDRFAEAHSSPQQKQQSGSKSSRRQQYESEIQKKRADEALTEKTQDEEESARTRRMMDTIRAKYPMAQSDMEAMAYAFRDSDRRDRADIAKLEKETDAIEKDVKDELEKRLGSLGGIRGRAGDALKQVQATNDKQQEILNKLIQIDTAQSQQLDALAASVAQPGTEKVPSTVRVQPSTATVIAPPPQMPAPVAATPDPAPTTDPEPTQVAGDEITDIGQFRASPEPTQTTPASQEPRARKQKQAKLSLVPPPPERRQNPPPERRQRTRAPAAAGSIQKVAEQDDDLPGLRIGIRGLGEQRITPSNRDLWARARVVAESKFDKKSSHMAKTWAAKWYKAHGGEWLPGEKK
jgi:hypothetical protein